MQLIPDDAEDSDAAADLDERISRIFYHFEKLTTVTSGRTVGRKIGVVQEIILRKYLEGSDELRRRMYLEQGLHGYSGASHKVEFSWYAANSVQCEVGDPIAGVEGLSVVAMDELTRQVKIALKGQKPLWIGGAAVKKGPYSVHLAATSQDLRICDIEGGVATIDVLDRSRLLASLESKRVGAQRFADSDKLGAGIQTIEKAKQASLVAIDIDMKYNGSIKPLEVDGQKNTLSMVALGNGVHWTKKDKAVLGTYVDYTFLVKDDGIIRYADFVAETMPDGGDFMPYFMDYFKGMTKQDPDDFQVGDDDFEIIVPATEQRTLQQVLIDHVLAVNP